MSATLPVRLAAVDIRFEQDVVLARQRARELAHSLGFERQIQTSIATAVSEIARNAFRYAGGGRAEFSVLTEPNPADARRKRQTLVIEVCDSGPGIAKLEEVLAGRYRSETGMGVGIIGTHRLMDRVQIASGATGTTVTLEKILPPSTIPRTAQELEALVDDLTKRAPSGPLEELQIQNQELLAAIEEARRRQDELARVNYELAETNRGVLALYDELETLNRITMMLASKIELKPLIQSMIDVTTTLTNAEIGVFFLHEDDGHWHLLATAGARADALGDFPERVGRDLFPEGFADSGLEHIHNLSVHAEPSVAANFAKLLGDKFVVRSCLTVPVLDAHQTLIGAFLFVGGTAQTFTERSERILGSIAAQAAVGIDKARLFHSVTAASEAKDQFFATLSHELRTPLTPALVIASSLEADSRVPQELQEDLAIITRNIRLEARLIDDLLDFNRLIKGKMELVTDVVDVRFLIESVMEICHEDLAFKQHQLITELDSPTHTVVGDGGRLQQVFWNVLKNAIKFTPSKGCIRIRTESVGERLRVEIVDNGIGFDLGSAERIFTAFDQGRRPVDANFGGLGLGLSIARMFVELHHGSISACSPGPGKGATIAIELPVCAASVPHSEAPPTVSAPPTRNHGRILLVDDHPDTLASLTRLLRRIGFEITAVPNGASALAAAGLQTFDLLISDLGLPDYSGLELVSKIHTLQQMPSIALSGYGMESDLVQSRTAGFQRHITKPVEFEQLIDAVNTLLGKRE